MKDTRKERRLENLIGNYLLQTDTVFCKRLILKDRDWKPSDGNMTKEMKKEGHALKIFIKQKAYEYRVKNTSENHITFYMDIRKFALTIPRYIPRVLPFKFPQQELLQLVYRKEL